MSNSNNTIETQFQSLVNGTTGHEFPGVVGTSSEVRSAVWDEFRSKYNTGVNVTIKGIDIQLLAHHSLSGKSTSYHATLTAEQYITIMGSDFGLSTKKAPHIIIDGGYCTLYGGDRFFTKMANQDIFIN